MSGPTVLILGGLSGDGPRQLLPYLFSPECPPESRPSFVRVVDKHLAIPAAGAYTFFADPDLRRILEKGSEDGTVEYIQGNLLVQATRTKVFTLPDARDGKGFDHVYDFTGETDFRAPDLVHVDRTLRLALLLGQAAIDGRVGAYVRTLPSFYKLKSDESKKGLKVGSERAGDAEPWGTLSRWWHEAARGLAKLEALPLVVVRPAVFYGDYTVTGFTPRALIGEVYRFENEPMAFLWSENLACNTCHIADFAAALGCAAAWARAHGSRSAIIGAYSVNLVPAFDSNKPFAALSEGPSPVVPAKKEEKAIRAAVFNVEDGGDTDQKTMAKLIEHAIGVKTGFHGSIVSTFAKLNLSDVVEDANEKHLEGWSALLQASDPPINTTVPISPQVPVDLLSPYPIALDSSALRRLTGWKPTRKLDVETVKASIEGFRKEGFWPNAVPRKPAVSAASSTTRSPSRTPSLELLPHPAPIASASTSASTSIATPSYEPTSIAMSAPLPQATIPTSMHPYYPPMSLPPAPHAVRPALLPHSRANSYHSNENYTSTSPISLSLVDVARAKEAALSNLGKARTKVTARTQAQPINRQADPVDHGVLTDAEAAELFEHFHSTLNAYLILFDRHLHTVSYVRQTSTVLFTSLLAVSAKFFRPDLYPTLLAHAKALTGQAMADGTASVAIVQSLFLLVYWKEPFDQNAWLKVGYAIRLAYQLHLHKERKLPLADFKDEFEARLVMDRERTWICATIFDHLYILRLDEEEDDGFCQTSMIQSFRINPVEWLADTRKYQVDDDIELGPTLEWVKVLRLAKDIAHSRPSHARSLSNHLQGILESAYDRWVTTPTAESTPAERRRAIRIQFFMNAAFVALHRASLEATELTEEGSRRYHVNGVNDQNIARFITYSQSLVESMEDLEREGMVPFFQDLLAPSLYAFGEFLVKLYPGCGPHTRATILDLLTRTHRAFDNAAAGRDDTTPAFISRFFQLTLRILGAAPAPAPGHAHFADAAYAAAPVNCPPNHPYEGYGVAGREQPHPGHAPHQAYLPPSFVNSINDDTQYWDSLLPGGTGWFDQTLDDLLRT
ncbi:uncharacterized protein JCM15063_000562 [Sporobolomyces koalae]|uniref:uncharacterized protein n=1 Tax=Sporobolomyces koalae TaxID=500713 RepID=UPI0031825723